MGRVSVVLHRVELTGHPWEQPFPVVNDGQAKNNLGQRNISSGICTPPSQTTIFLPFDLFAIPLVAAEGRAGLPRVEFFLFSIGADHLRSAERPKFFEAAVIYRSFVAADQEGRPTTSDQCRALFDARVSAKPGHTHELTACPRQDPTVRHLPAIAVAFFRCERQTEVRR